MKHTVIIAEAGVNHNGSLENAFKLVDAAASAGVDYVKFQTFKSDKLVSKIAQKANYQVENTQDIDESQFQMLKKLELSEEDHAALIGYCKSKNVEFFSTAFDLGSLAYLSGIGIGMVKIPSGEITNLPYLRLAAKQFSKVILSTGMATIEEIEAALEVFLKAGIPKKNISILHCNTEYPTPMKDVNLLAMLHLKETFGISIGYSDHTLGIEVPIAAVALGATIIEKHFTLDRSMKGPDHQASLEPGELKQMVLAIRNIEMAISGTGIKEPSPSEMKNIVIARKSIHLLNSLAENDSIQDSDLEMLRPGDGISPMDVEKVIGRKLNKNLPAGTKLSLNDLL
ncbi:N-acetylneuraminate synthase [Pedobacter hartonius]|uniref:N-acetylneuraminate synthase n=1 Tax=Pedobacter hartonius TaxID=425514 RepID=A0A1H4FRL4_9SPHI|nr:N-acetylneuraminate synthase [Pedobacter hartonius]SEA99956.1 N-acetylneuraminate synthase [Pedobacter hartonius]